MTIRPHHHTRLIRFTIVALFLWFGSQQLIDAASWTAFLPGWVGYFPIPAETIIQWNGLFEVIGALMLAVGAYVRIVAALLGLHLMGIAASVGGAIGVRDAALAVCTLALVIAPTDEWSIDARIS